MTAFFGELYLRSTRPFLTAERTGAEVEYLSRALVGSPGPVLDAGCGHGRHASALTARHHRVIGLERDPLSLAEREPGFLAVRGDFHAPPFPDASFPAAYAWYNTLFADSDEANAHALSQLTRCLVPGGLFLLQVQPAAWMAEHPTALYSGRLPNGALLEERNTFDAGARRDVGDRRLTLPDGRRLEARYAIRCLEQSELAGLCAAAGLELGFVHGDLAGGPPTPASKEWVVGARRIR